MTTPSAIRFDDGAAYEEGMGRWSLIAGDVFLDWLAPETGLRWLDVGCGSGAFAELIMQRCAPAEVQGIDPSDAQLAFARGRTGARGAVFRIGDAMALPFAGDRFDAAVMALVIFFVPEPAKAVAEMVRVVRPGGIVAAYVWDAVTGGSPTALIQSELRAMGITPPSLPSRNASAMDAMRELWVAAGLQAIETREITVQRHFADADAYWASASLTDSVRPVIAGMELASRDRLKQNVCRRLLPGRNGGVMHTGRANAVRGRVPM